MYFEGGKSQNDRGSHAKGHGTCPPQPCSRAGEAEQPQMEPEQRQSEGGPSGYCLMVEKRRWKPNQNQNTAQKTASLLTSMACVCLCVRDCVCLCVYRLSLHRVSLSLHPGFFPRQ